MSKANDWMKSNCKFAQVQGQGGAAVTGDALTAAARTGIENMLKAMGQGNENIVQDIAEAKPIIDNAIRTMGPALTTLSQQLTDFFTEKTKERSVVNQQNIQQAVENPTAPAPQ
jgi:uncharacterized membrane protein